MKNKKLWNKTCTIKNKLQDIISNDLQFEAQDEDVKKVFYKSIDKLNEFIDNIK